jgi:hypothetical protein
MRAKSYLSHPERINQPVGRDRDPDLGFEGRRTPQPTADHSGLYKEEVVSNSFLLWKMGCGQLCQLWSDEAAGLVGTWCFKRTTSHEPDAKPAIPSRSRASRECTLTSAPPLTSNTRVDRVAEQMLTYLQFRTARNRKD